ncbi:hypothetical protein LZ30DRAFT_704186 [Colletotrichum cereale]|nr:hypothetical protein LZ30DRAFT_704186 [Colletotrichum cereale]
MSNLRLPSPLFLLTTTKAMTMVVVMTMDSHKDGELSARYLGIVMGGGQGGPGRQEGHGKVSAAVLVQCLTWCKSDVNGTGAAASGLSECQRRVWTRLMDGNRYLPRVLLCALVSAGATHA